MIVTTGTFGQIETSQGLLMSWDTDAPDPGPATPGERRILDGMSASWSIEVLPPVTSPATVQFSVYMAGPDVAGQWLPMDLGDAISINAFAYHDTLGSLELFTIKGRVADVSGRNHPDGGIVFSVIVADRLADLGSQGSPALLDTDAEEVDPALPPLFYVYDQVIDDAGIDLDYHAGETWPEPEWWFLTADVIDAANRSTLDVLSTAIAHDWRPDDIIGGPTDYLWGRYLVQQIDTGTTDPEETARYRLQEWDPRDVNGLAGVSGMHWTGAEWVVIENDDYYFDAGADAGLVLFASNLARDVGQWRKVRDQAINTIELTSPSAFIDGTKSTRVTFADLVSAYGPNTRNVETWWGARDDARAWGRELLMVRDQVQVTGYGFTELVIAFETLSTDQVALIDGAMFPQFGVNPVGQPFAIAGIPDDWRLADSAVLTGRVMGVTIALQDGKVRYALQTRTVPPSAIDGITIDQVGDLSPEPTFDNIDDTVTIDAFAVVGPGAL